MSFHWLTHQCLDTLFLETHWSQKPGNKIFMADPDFLPLMNLFMLTPPFSSFPFYIKFAVPRNQISPGSSVPNMWGHRRSLYQAIHSHSMSLRFIEVNRKQGMKSTAS